MVSEVRYHPYGQERWTNGATPTDFGFTSQRNEASFGLMDYNARYYSPVLGRFVSPDSIVPEPTSSGGFNRYRYVRNNPLRYTDPTGHYTVDPDTGECFGGDCDNFWDGPPPDEESKQDLQQEQSMNLLNDLDAIGWRFDASLGIILEGDVNIDAVWRLPSGLRYGSRGFTFEKPGAADVFVIATPDELWGQEKESRIGETNQKKQGEVTNGNGGSEQFH